MATAYEEYQVANAPVQRSGFWGDRLTRVYGVFKDAIRASATSAVKLRHPLIAPPDALPRLASERNITGRHNESDTTFRRRIANAWTQWTMAGTKPGLIKALNDGGYPTVTVFESWDIATAFYTPPWHHFWVVLQRPLPYTGELGDGTWESEGTWDDGGVWAYDMPDDEKEHVRALIRKWKPSHATCAGIIILFNGELWDLPLEAYDPTSEVWDDSIAAFFNL